MLNINNFSALIALVGVFNKQSKATIAKLHNEFDLLINSVSMASQDKLIRMDKTLTKSIENKIKRKFTIYFSLSIDITNNCSYFWIHYSVFWI